MRVAFYTLGCKVNQAEAGALQKLFFDRGHTVVPFDENADLYVVTTCTVTKASDKKCRQAIRRVRRDHLDAVIAVCGCYSQINPDEVKTLGADIICGVTDRKNIVALAEEYRESASPQNHVQNVAQFRTFEPLFSDSNQGRTRALLKIQDGCDNFCSYCIIPFARGRSRSMLPDEAVSEALRLKNEGFLEIVVTGIEISSYGKDLPHKSTLTDLLRRILLEVPDIRIRLGSLEPGTIDDLFCQTLSGFPNLCPHFHLSLQSGSDRVLARMGRKYTASDYFAAVEKLHAYFPGCAVTTDLIVGFPGETDADFEESLLLLKRCALFSVHVFPYSRREGTRADSFDGQLSKTVKELRVRKAMDLAADLKSAYLGTQVGKTEEVLFESSDNGFFTGHLKNYCPVRVLSEKGLKNSLRMVHIACSDGETLSGELLSD